MMSLIPDIADGQQSAAGDLPLEGKHVVVGVGNAIAVVEERVGGKGHKVGPVYRRIRVGSGNTVQRKRKGESLAVVEASGGGDEGGSHQRRSGAQVIETERGHGVHN